MNSDSFSGSVSGSTVANATTESATATKTSKPRGFAALSPEVRRAISSKGGRAAHLAGTAHEFAHDEAVAAGRKGGLAVSAMKRAAMAKQNGY